MARGGESGGYVYLAFLTIIPTEDVYPLRDDH